jgi:hypothetical protein
MNFLELRERLQSKPAADFDAVCFATDLSAAMTDNSWVIWRNRPGYDVGFCEDGDFDLFDTFDSEDEACDWLYARLARRPDILGVEEIRARRERLLGRINRMDRTAV